jgi:gas vesicle protein
MANDSGGSSLGALLLGLGTGLALGFLFAPRPGEETREIIVDRTREGMALAAEAVEELKMQFETAMLNAGETVQSLKDRAGEAVWEAQEKFHEAVREGQDAYRTELRERQAQLEVLPRSTTLRSV